MGRKYESYAMALVTLCPECSTTFRVTSEQLEVHSGDVRCGQCQHVFNSFTTLITVEESEISFSSKVTPPAFSETSTTVEARDGINDFDKTSLMQLDLNYFSEKNTVAYDNEDFDSIPVKEKLNLGWTFANFALMFLLIGQIAYFYRVDISVAAPATKPLLVSYCAMLNCTVPYPQDITLLNIESSELYANPVRQDESTMTATIRNYASFPQVLPALKLSLTDTQGKLIVSRVFYADDYLGENAASMQSIEPNHEINIRIDYISGELNAMGYQLHLLYP